MLRTSALLLLLALPARLEERRGPPVQVGAELVEPLDVARQLLDTVGAKLVREAELAALTDWGRARYGEATSMIDLEREVDRRERLLASSYGEDPLERVQVRIAGSREVWRRRVALEARFDRVFLPLDPAPVPAPSWEAFRAEGGELLVVELRSSRVKGRRARALERDGREPWPDPFWCVYREVVLEHLLDGAADGLPPELVRRIDPDHDGLADAELGTAELFERLAPQLDASEVETARAFLAALSATRQQLARTGRLIDEAEVLEADDAWTWERERWLRELCPAPTARNATLQVVESLRRAGPPPLTDAQAARAFDRIDVDVLLVSAWDFEGARWREDGWARAEARAHELRALLPSVLRTDAQRAQWDALLDAESELTDPPLRTDVGGGTAHGFHHDHGRFRRRSFEELARHLGEPPYWRIQGEPGVAQRAFEEAEVDRVLGPVRSARGYALVRVLRRIPGDERGVSHGAVEAALRLSVERAMREAARR